MKKPPKSLKALRLQLKHSINAFQDAKRKIENDITNEYKIISGKQALLPKLKSRIQEMTFALDELKEPIQHSMKDAYEIMSQSSNSDLAALNFQLGYLRCLDELAALAPKPMFLLGYYDRFKETADEITKALEDVKPKLALLSKRGETPYTVHYD